jgi:hypothetical protein
MVNAITAMSAAAIMKNRMILHRWQPVPLVGLFRDKVITAVHP